MFNLDIPHEVIKPCCEEQEHFDFPRNWLKKLNDFVDTELINKEQSNRILSLLLSEGCDINTKNNYTPIEIALSVLLVEEHKEKSAIINYINPIVNDICGDNPKLNYDLLDS